MHNAQTFRVSWSAPAHKAGQCQYTLATIAIIAAVVAAGAAGYGAYASNEAAQDQAKAQKRAARQQAEAETAAGEARRKQARMKYERFRDTQRSRAGAAGVVVGEGSLLEGQMEAAQLAQYEADLAAYGHELSSQRASFEEKIFGWRARKLADSQYMNTGIAVGSSLASSYLSGAGKGLGGGGGGGAPSNVPSDYGMGGPD